MSSDTTARNNITPDKQLLWAFTLVRVVLMYGKIIYELLALARRLPSVQTYIVYTLQ